VDWNPECELPPFERTIEHPELAIAVWGGHRGQGIGSGLIGALENAARIDGVVQMSLSVDAGNPARRLYVRLGYEELTVDDDGVRMLKTL
jgi:GNAT superfamily N-acetyltransferase